MRKPIAVLSENQLIKQGEILKIASYIIPSEVVSPKIRWSLIAVLDDGGEGGSALAIGRWDREVALTDLPPR
jgi:hypothetical protein